MSETGQGTSTVVLRLYAVLLIAIGLALLGGGGYLLSIGGSLYYAACGLAVIASGVLLWRRDARGFVVFGAMLLVTVAWAIWEVGADGWALMPRILAPVVLGVFIFLTTPRRAFTTPMPCKVTHVIGGIVVAIAIGAALHAAVPPARKADPLYQTGMAQAPAPKAVEQSAAEWQHWGNELGGSRYSTLTEINASNVSQLEPAWTYEVTKAPTRLEATPLQIGNRLYLCSGQNDIIALDAETGQQVWRFDAGIPVAQSRLCRGVGYYKTEAATGACAERIITNTVDARLIAVDARDGQPCKDFGTEGQVSLLGGFGDVVPGYYYVTSAPTIIHGKIILGGWVSDNQYWGEPSGVIRAFDVITGKLAWAWDMGHPDRTGEPPAGETYTTSSPNAWAPMSADDKLGLVYVPLGNPTPDIFGGLRRPFDEQYGSALVALDVATGRPKWSFQTSHHDLWDFDIASQPTLTDITTADGVVPAVVQPTKRGEVFVLNRETGAPIHEIKELPVSTKGGVPEERYSPTQPFSLGMPSFRGADIIEADMWGVTPLDQLWCRVKFREARYDGPHTPPGLTPSIDRPTSTGASNWGGVAIDKARNIGIFNTSYLLNYTRLLTRDEVEKAGLKRLAAHMPLLPGGLGRPQEGTPYGVKAVMMMSPLEVPCNRPPYGLISAVDLTTGKLIWSQPFGSARDIGPWGIRSRLPLNIGTYNIGGAVVTKGDVFFISATQDRMLRAFETTTGRLLWQADLPGGGFATPMTYTSAESGRQFVVISTSGGAIPGVGGGGTHVVAYALPKAKKP